MRHWVRDLGPLYLRLGHLGLGQMRLRHSLRLAHLRGRWNGWRHLHAWGFDRMQRLLRMIHDHPWGLAANIAFILHTLRQPVGALIIKGRAGLSRIPRRLNHWRAHRFHLIG